MAPKPPTVSEQRARNDRLRAELQTPAVMNNPQRKALLEQQLEAGQKLFRELRAREGK